MLSVEKRFMIKDLHRKGLSISEIARQTGNDRKTLRRLLAAPLLPSAQPRQAKRPKLDPFVPYLEKRITEGVLNTPKLLREIRALDYPGGITQLRLFLQPFRPQDRRAQPRRGRRHPLAAPPPRFCQLLQLHAAGQSALSRPNQGQGRT